MHDADEKLVTGQQVMLQMFVRSRGSDSSERFAEVPTFLSSFPIPTLIHSTASPRWMRFSRTAVWASYFWYISFRFHSGFRSSSYATLRRVV